MTKSSLQHTNKILYSLLIVATCLFVFFLTAVVSFLISAKQLFAGNFHAAAKWSQVANISISPVQVASLYKSPTINTIKFVSTGISDLPTLQKKIGTLFENQPEEALLDLNTINALIADPAVENIYQGLKNLEKSIIYRYLSPDLQNAVTDILAFFPDIKIILTELKEKDQTIIVLFQNNNEIRATGGFMGSYALIPIHQGIVKKPIIEDIFDADGQFDGFVAAPPGLSEYLSGGNGMRLPDANWHPDFVSSAKNILPFFALGNKQNISILSAVTTDFAKEILKFIGPITITDYNTVVTEDNIDEVLRSRRDSFFAGSTQKKHLLSQLLVQMSIKLNKTSLGEKLSLYSILLDQFSKNTIQLYANNPTIDAIFHEQSLRLELGNEKPTENFVYLVESNVGINKANKGVERSTTIINEDKNITLEVLFHNTNKQPSASLLQEVLENKEAEFVRKSPDHLAYINYQRIIVPADWQLLTAEYDSTPIEHIDQSILIVNDKKMKEIGFLLIVLEEQKGSLKMSFEAPVLPDIAIFKQPGIPSSLYTLQNQRGVFTEELSRSKTLTFPQ